MARRPGFDSPKEINILLFAVTYGLGDCLRVRLFFSLQSVFTQCLTEISIN
jgi:hypothetical protein